MFETFTVRKSCGMIQLSVENSNFHKWDGAWPRTEDFYFGMDLKTERVSHHKTRPQVTVTMQ